MECGVGADGCSGIQCRHANGRAATGQRRKSHCIRKKVGNSGIVAKHSLEALIQPFVAYTRKVVGRLPPHSLVMSCPCSVLSIVWTKIRWPETARNLLNPLRCQLRK